MKTFTKMLALLCVLPTLLFASNQEEYQKVISNQIFRNVELNGRIYAEVVQSPEETITIRSKSKEAVDGVEAHAFGQGFIINRPKQKDIHDDVFITIATEGLVNLNVKGSARVASKGVLSYRTLTIASKGSGDLRIDFGGQIINLNQTGSGEVLLNLDTEVLNINLRGSGNIDANGQVDHQHINLVGSGNFDGEQLCSRIAEVKSKGSGDITVNVTERLAIRHSGSGDIIYYGYPRITKEGWGSGSIKKGF